MLRAILSGIKMESLLTTCGLYISQKAQMSHTGVSLTTTRYSTNTGPIFCPLYRFHFHNLASYNI